MGEVSILTKRSNNSVVNKAQLYHKQDGSEDPISVGQYEGKNWLDTGEEMRPEFDAEEGKWRFAGTQEDIEKLLTEVVLNHEFGVKEGTRITPNDVNIYNIKDPLFNHSIFIRETEKSKLSLKHTDPLDNFLYLCLIASEDIADPQEDNPAVSGDTRYDVLELGAEEKKNVESINLVMEVTSVINALDQKKLSSVCRALNHPLFFPAEDLSLDSLKMTAYQRMITEGPEMKDKSGKLYLEKFLELAKLTKRELELKELLTFSMKKGIISVRRDGNFYYFHDRETSEVLEDVLDESNLFEKLLTKDGISLQNGDDLLSALRKRYSEQKK